MWYNDRKSRCNDVIGGSSGGMCRKYYIYIVRLVVMRVMILTRHTSLHRLGLILRIFGNVNVNPSGIFMETHHDGPQIEIMMLSVLIAKMIIIILTVLQPHPCPLLLAVPLAYL